MKKKNDKSLILNIIIFFIVLVLIAFLVFYQQVKSYQKEIDEKERTIEIYKKENKEDDKTSEQYAKKLSQAKEEIKKVKKETNYKGYNELSVKEQDKQLDKYNEGTSKYNDLVLISKKIKENKDIDKARIVKNNDGIGQVEVPKGMLNKVSKDKVVSGLEGSENNLNETEQIILEDIDNSNKNTPNNILEPSEPIQPSAVENNEENNTEVPIRESYNDTATLPLPDTNTEENTSTNKEQPSENVIQEDIPSGDIQNESGSINTPDKGQENEHEDKIEEDTIPMTPLEPSLENSKEDNVNESIPLIPLEPSIDKEDVEEKDNAEENPKEEVENTNKEENKNEKEDEVEGE